MAIPLSAYLLFPFLFLLSFTCSAFSEQISSSFASTQVKFWSENVVNKMPVAISSKLSPLSKRDSDYYSKAISLNSFKADTKFCSLAKLACSIESKKGMPNQAKVYDEFKKGTEPNQAKVYDEIKKGTNQAKVYDEIFKKGTVPNQAKVYDEIFKKGTEPNQAKVYDEILKGTEPNQAKVNNEFKKGTEPNQAQVYDEILTGTEPNQAKVYDAFKINEVKISYSAATPLEKSDPFLFFRLSILQQGNTIHLSNLKETLPFRTFLPPQIASKISLLPKSITNIFPESKEAMETTLSHCNSLAIKGELKACPKSLEEMISFSKTALGTNKLLSLTSKSTAGSGQVLTIKKIKHFNVEKVVACHEMFLPFATYFCHSLLSSRIYSVDFVHPKTGTPVNTAVAICHMDTSSWPENHVAFKMLKFGPGQGEACHWMNEIDLAWIGVGGKL